MSGEKMNRFSIGVVGFLDSTEKTDAAHVKVTSILSAITERVLAKEYEYDQTPQERVRFDFYTSPLIAGDFWPGFCQHWNMGSLCVVVPEDGGPYPSFDSPALYKTTIASALKGAAQIHCMTDWVASQIDIAFALWDGNEAAHDGSIWMFIERCKQNGIPVIWIDTTDYDKSFWFRKIYPEPFHREALWQYIDGFYIQSGLPDRIEQVMPRSFLFAKQWARISRAYEKRAGVQPVFDETKTAAQPQAESRAPVQFEDVLLRHRADRFYLERSGENDADFDKRTRNFEFLRDAFHLYEDAADRISPAIRATLYCRTWVPLLSTIFLAVGFYAETIMRFVTGQKNILLARQWPADAWAFIAGIGFLLSAFMFFYNRKNILPHKKNMDFYIICRYVDEYLRIALHFLAYGLPVSERILNKAIRNADDPAKQKGAVLVRRLLRSREPASVFVNMESCTHMTKHLQEFFITQIDYQTVGRKQRFEGILGGLTRGITILLWANLIMLGLRGLLQFAAGALPFDTLTQDSPLYWLTYSSGGKTLVDFSRAFANMTALMITAWYDKYLRQRDMNHYGGYLHIAQKILSELHIYKKKTDEIAARQQNGSAVSYDWLRSLAEDTMESLTSELYWWCDETTRS